MRYSHLFPHGFLKGDAWRINTLHTGKARLQQLFSIADSSCYQTDWDIARFLQDSHRQLTHQRLPVSRTFTRNHEVSIFDHLLEAYRLK